jgi:UDP-glucose:(heptosyl)LPS alpha-1,3-glucosyltransferase
VKLLVIARPFSVHGGVERATAGLLAALAEHGHAVEVLSPGPQPPIPGVSVRRLPVPPLPPAARLLAVAAAARVVVAAARWDVVQSHERTISQDVYRAGEGCHRAYLATLGQPPGRRLYHRLVLALEKRALTRTPRIVAIARRGREEIGRWYGVGGSRVAVVYNGVDLERFHPRNRSAHRARALAEVDVAPDGFVLLFVGSGFERKGLASAVAALADLGDPSSRLLVVGKGAIARYREQALRRGVDGQVRWLGVRADTERWYAAADAFVLPTRYEPFGNAHLEALASGVPVIASERAGGAELIADGVSGAVVNPIDSGAIATAIRKLRDRPWAEASRAARLAAEPFTHAAQVAGLEEVYRGLPRARLHNP